MDNSHIYRYNYSFNGQIDVLGHVNNDQPMQSCQRALVELSQTHELFQVLCRFVLEAAVTKVGENEE